MNGATYHVTTPAQLELHRQERAAARAQLVRTIELSRLVAQRMGVKLPVPAAPRSRS